MPDEMFCHINSHYCKIPTRIAQLPAKNSTERLAKELLIFRLSLPTTLDREFTDYALNQLKVARTSYYRAMQALADWGFVHRVKKRVGVWEHDWGVDIRFGPDGRPFKDSVE